MQYPLDATLHTVIDDMLSGCFFHFMPLYFLHAGQTGNPVNLYANYFKVESSPDWQMYQYHVDFNPPIDSRKMRKGMLYDHAQKLFKAHLFDGMMLFTNSKLDEVCHLLGLDLSNVCKTKPKIV